MRREGVARPGLRFHALAPQKACPPVGFVRRGPRWGGLEPSERAPPPPKETAFRNLVHTRFSQDQARRALRVELPRSEFLCRKDHLSGVFWTPATTRDFAHSTSPRVWSPTRRRQNATRDARGSTRLSQGFCWYDSSGDGDRDRVGQIYAAQFVARRIQICFDAGERQIQNPSNVVVSLASRRPDQTLLLSFRQFDRLRRQFEIDARGGVDQNSHWL
jgi:hypothetical protein